LGDRRETGRSARVIDQYVDLAETLGRTVYKRFDVGLSLVVE
jgi:hypothetical protein